MIFNVWLSVCQNLSVYNACVDARAHDQKYYCAFKLFHASVVLTEVTTTECNG